MSRHVRVYHLLMSSCVISHTLHEFVFHRVTFFPSLLVAQFYSKLRRQLPNKTFAVYRSLELNHNFTRN